MPTAQKDLSFRVDCHETLYLSYLLSHRRVHGCRDDRVFLPVKDKLL
jgi:hypothetical protein